jgi:molecular chaperone DnaJ
MKSLYVSHQELPMDASLRVKGRGITKGTTVGDLLVTIEVQVPQRVEGEALDALKKYAEATADQEVRKEFNTKALQ